MVLNHYNSFAGTCMGIQIHYRPQTVILWCLFCSFFNIFQQSWKMFMHSDCLSVCPPVHALTLVNIFQMSWNLNILLMSKIAWTVLKMVYMGPGPVLCYWAPACDILQSAPSRPSQSLFKTQWNINLSIKTNTNIVQ